MNVLVTGGAGFIGSHTVERLLESGASVRVLDNFSSGKRCNLPTHPRLQTVEADIGDRAAVEQALDGIGQVLHLAAQVSVAASVAAPLESARTNVAGFLNVLDAARRRQVRRFVYASSSAVYGDPAQALAGEGVAPSPLSPYGLEKSINDLYGAMYSRLYGLSILGLRYFNVFGPRQDPSSPYSGVISVFVDHLRRREALTVFGDGRQTRDFVFVDDVAEVNRRALAAPLQGVCNVATGRTASLLELIAVLGKTAGLAPQLRFEAERAGDIRHSRADNTRLRTELAMHTFTGLSAGLQRLWSGTPLRVIK